MSTNQQVRIFKQFFIILVILATLRCFPQSTASTYAYYMTNTTSFPGLNETNDVYQILTASILDDAPFDIIDLWSSYSFYSQYRVIAVDPNGAIHFTDESACCTGGSCYFENPSTGCTVNASLTYTNLIMPFLCDLNPSASDTSFVKYFQSYTRITVLWENVQVYNPIDATYPLPPPNTFSATLYANGGIRFIYYNVSDPRDIPLIVSNYTFPPRTWLVGLRMPYFLDFQTENQADWFTASKGVYPPIELVRSGIAIDFCRLSTNFCLYPASGPLTPITLYLSTPTTLCASGDYNHSYRCQFVPISTLAGASSARVSAPPNVTFESTAAAFDSQTQTWRCVSPFSSSPGYVQVLLYDVTSDIEVYTEEPLYFQYLVDASVTSPLTASSQFCATCGSANPTQCPLDCSNTYGGSASLDLCGICAGGNTGIIPNSGINCEGRCYTNEPWNRSTTLPSERELDCVCGYLLNYTSGLPSYDSVPTGNQTYGSFHPFSSAVIVDASCPTDSLSIIHATFDVFDWYELLLLILCILGMVFILIHTLYLKKTNQPFIDPYSYWTRSRRSRRPMHAN